MSTTPAPDSANKEKFELLQQYLEDEHVLVHINPAAEEVVLPVDLKANPTTTLKLSHFFARPLDINIERASAELSFSGKPFLCNIPLAAIWGILSLGGKQHFWPQSAGPEILGLLQLGMSQAAAEAKKEPQPGASEKPRKITPALSLAKGIQVPNAASELPLEHSTRPATGAVASDRPAPPAPKRSSERPRGGHLKRIK